MRRIYQIVLIGGCLVLAGYLFIRFYLQKEVKRSVAKNNNTTVNVADSATQQPKSVLDLRPLFIAKLKQVVKDGSKGLYDLTVDSMDVDVLNSSAVLKNVSLVPDSMVSEALKKDGSIPDDVFKASFASLRIEGINLDDIITRKTIDFNSIHFQKPVVEVFHQKNASEKKDIATLYQRLMKHMKSIKVKQLFVEEGRLVYHNPLKNKTTRINSVALRLNDLRIDSTTQYAKDRFLFAKSGVLSVRNYIKNTADNPYVIKIKKLTVAAPEKLMTMKGVSVSLRQHQQKKQRQKEEYDLKIPNISIQNIRWWELMEGDSFMAGNLVINGGKLKVFLDRSLPPPKSKMGNFPNQLLARLPMKVLIEKTQLKNFDLTYQEYNPRSKMKGTVYFKNVWMTSTAITNIKEEMQKRRTTTLTASARLMNKIPLNTRFVFDLTAAKKGGFSSTLTTGAFDGNVVNDLTIPLGLMKIEKGKVKETKMYIKGNEDAASGDVTLLYNDLKISIYEKEADEKGLDKRGILGLLANTFVIKDDNPKNGEAVRQPHADFQRDPLAGFFNLVWKTGLVGVLKTIGANPKLAQKK